MNKLKNLWPYLLILIVVFIFFSPVLNGKILSKSFNLGLGTGVFGLIILFFTLFYVKNNQNKF